MQCLNLDISGETRQERALLSDPLVQGLFVTLYAQRPDEQDLQNMQRLPNLKDLRLDECGVPAPLRCAFLSLKILTLQKCTLDASGCPAIPTLGSLLLMDCKVLLNGAGHPFPWISQDAQCLHTLHLSRCEVVDLAGTGQVHIDAPQLWSVSLWSVSFCTRSHVCSLAGPQGVTPRLLSASVDSPILGEARRYDQEESVIAGVLWYTNACGQWCAAQEHMERHHQCVWCTLVILL
jgi:hypothetical protein